ncbi:MAG: hypothetical protein KAH21_00665, partial [Spirochaetaceae bacterium]|nr:hypothetical protein [Spirochaetaceae bacterium]
MKGLTKLKILILIAAVLLSSCRTIPEGPYRDIVNWLPEDSDIIIRMVVPENIELVDFLIAQVGLDPRDFETIKNRTALLAMGMELGDSGDIVHMASLPIHLASIGIWPKNFMGSGLGKEWKKSGLSRYRWTGPDNLELLALSNDEIILSRGKIDEMLERLEEGSSNSRIKRAIDLRNDAALAIWITSPEFVLDSIPMLPASNPDGSPLIDIIGLALRKRDDGNFSLYFSIYPTDERLTGSLALAMRLGFSSRFGLSPDPEERALLSQLSVEVSTGEVRMLLSSVSLELLDSFLEGINLFPEGLESE